MMQWRLGEEQQIVILNEQGSPGRIVDFSIGRERLARFLDEPRGTVGLLAEMVLNCGPEGTREPQRPCVSDPNAADRRLRASARSIECENGNIQTEPALKKGKGQVFGETE